MIRHKSIGCKESRLRVSLERYIGDVCECERKKSRCSDIGDMVIWAFVCKGIRGITYVSLELRSDIMDYISPDEDSFSA